MNVAEKLLLNIAKNHVPQNVFDKLIHKQNSKSCYKKIVQNQIDNGIKEMHLPEPWNGHLLEAKIMFISSNPSFDINENFPTKKWSKEKIIDFFDKRFFNSNQKICQFWKSISKYVLWLYPESKNLNITERLNKYAVSTEIVHCKSKKEIGLKECIFKEKQFIDQILELFKGKYIIILGKTAEKNLDISKLKKTYKNIIICTMSHPNARGIKDKDRKNKLFKMINEQIK